MKKIGISMIVAVLLMLVTTIFVQAEKGGNLVSNYLGFAEQIMKEKQEEAMQGMIEHRQQLADTGENQLREFYLDKLVEAKGNVEQHQEDYLLQLKETKEVLKEKDLQEFEQQKTEQLQIEIGQDVEEYLEELLSEK
ncbi:hypothetical protein ACDX78_17335 [Virgibacillus oceani]